jgi:hypothetical protein
MQQFCKITATISLLCGLAASLVAAPIQLKLIVPATYLPTANLLVRVELRNPDGSFARHVWNAEALLTTPTAGITLSTNRVKMFNGIGSILLTVSGGGDFSLVADVLGLQASKTLQSLAGVPMTSVEGTLAGASSEWSGIMLVTGDVTVPVGHTLTIRSNTWVLLNGVASGTTANDILVSGAIQSLGTEENPVTITCSNPALRWGQIRHNTAQPSVYRHTIITSAGRAPGEGHTGQAPAIRPNNSRVTFDGCSITDHASPAGTPGKIMQASGSDLMMTNCLLSRARMGPEIGGTAIQFLDSNIIDMRGPDDADGIYLHGQQAGQVIRLQGSLVAGGDDDGIDTLGSVVTIEDCIVRGYTFPGDDSKGISILGAEARIWHCLIADNTIGVSGKAGTGEQLTIRIDRCTILGNSYGVAVTNKTGSTPIVDYRITNSIVRAPIAIFTQYNPADIHIDYCNLAQAWPGNGNFTADPMFANTADNDFRLQPYSPCIDAGDPVSPLNADGSPIDVGYFTFLPPEPRLTNPQMLADGTCQFLLNAYTNRNYVIDVSEDATTWKFLKNVTQIIESSPVLDTTAPDATHRLYRARLWPE